MKIIAPLSDHGQSATALEKGPAIILPEFGKIIAPLRDCPWSLSGAIILTNSANIIAGPFSSAVADCPWSLSGAKLLHHLVTMGSLQLHWRKGLQ